MTKVWGRMQAVKLFLQSRLFAVSLLFVVLAFVVYRISTMTNAVYLVGESGRSLRYTTQDDLSRLLPGHGISRFEEPEGRFEQVNAFSLFPVMMTVDGKTTACNVEIGTTVGELLYEHDITYDGNDLLTPASEKPLERGDKIVLQRVDYEEYTVEKPIPYKTVRKNSPLISIGSTRRIQEGSDGVLMQTYVQRTVDGMKEDVQLLGERVEQQPVPETILIGSPAPVSPFDFDLEVDENGKPLHYSRLLRDQVATGYSARSGAKTASGRYAITGHVAVDPRVIPYGSRLYITSSDGRFVYGCAIAADTGTGLLAGVVDVDLFYDTYEESAMNGRKIVDIYVLD